MVTQELIQYIKSQLQSGQTKDAIKSNLITNGWFASDIESAFQTLMPNPTPEVSQQNPANLSKSHSLSPILVIVIFFMILGVGGIIYAAFFRNINPSSKKEVLSPTPTIQLTTIISPTIGQNSPDETIFYSSPEQGCGFRYLKSWKIDKQGTLTVLADPNNANFQQCNATLEKILACDVAVSTIPFTGTTSTAPGVTVSGLPPEKTHDEQVKELATQLAIGNNITSTTLNNLMGYEAPSTNSEGSTYNVLLQGSTNMILVQFPYKKTRADLNQGQLMILNSISEQ